MGVVFTSLALVTGMLWGRPTWGVFWVWDARLTSTALLLLLFLGYLAVRRLPADPHIRSRRAAVVALIAIIDVPIVHYSVDWWRSVHQPATISRLDPTIDGLMLFTLMTGIAVFLLFYLWMLVHRFRLEYLREQVAEHGLEHAIAERRAEAVTPVTPAGGGS
ncbi:MAG: cytochrome c biogenesis protein CcsA [Acidimicrobiia bacterium]|nr:cytochrome c biogenesis protein CcsA [Acidimicrobiia bacterium]